MSKKILPLEFHDFTVKPSEPGIKFVMFRLDRDGKMLGYEWGMANYFENGTFETITTDGITARVMKWAHLPSPSNIL